MKLLVLGAGVVGKQIVRTASAMPAFTAITVADRCLDRSAAVAVDVGATAIAVDAADHGSLVSEMTKADVVVSAIGPATRFGLRTLLAAIEARRPFVDITDDPHPTLEMLKLDGQAKAAGVTAVIGTGASPGISNMLAVAAGRELDRVDRLLTGWGSSGAIGSDTELTEGTNAALQHWVEQCSGTIPAFVDGRIVEVKPMQPVVVNYPGIGVVVGRTVGHPEPVTLARRFPELRHAVNIMSFPDFVFEGLAAAAEAVDSGASHAEGASIIARQLVSAVSTLASHTATGSEPHALMGDGPSLPPIWALAEGVRNGRATRVAASLVGEVPGGTGPMTGVPAALVAALLASGKLTAGPGVHTIETAVAPDQFFTALRPFLRDAAGGSVAAPIALVQADDGQDQKAVA